MSRRVMIGLGSNRGDTKANLQRALGELEARGIGRVLKRSSLWRTEPKGMTDPEEFMNAAVLIETSLSAEEFLQGLLAIERQTGRVRTPSSSPEPRTLDLDIFFWGDERINTPELVVPHPRLHQRRFALAPLCEIAPDFVHPALQQTLRALLDQIRDPARVERVPGDW